MEGGRSQPQDVRKGPAGATAHHVVLRREVGYNLPVRGKSGSAVGSNFPYRVVVIAPVAGSEIPYRYTSFEPATRSLAIVRWIGSAGRIAQNPVSGVSCRRKKESEAKDIPLSALLSSHTTYETV